MKKSAFLIFASFFLCSACVYASIIYVKHDATGNNDGSSWSDAYTSLQSAITSATTGYKIWVARGTYTPENKVGGTGDRFKTFQMKNGVAIYGGFAGDEDPLTFDLDDRDFEENETILSGNLGNDTRVYNVFYHYNLGLDNTAILDGFTIRDGLADDANNTRDAGAGMFLFADDEVNYSSPTLRNCIFKHNDAHFGGAVYISENCNPFIQNTTFYTNTAIYTLSSPFTIDIGMGGAVFSYGNASVFINCTFSNNHANADGGAIYFEAFDNGESLALTNCFFAYNTAPNGGALNAFIVTGQLSIVESSFTYNRAANDGGGVYIYSDDTTSIEDAQILIQNCVFENNTAKFGGGIFIERHAAEIISSIIRGNEAEYGGGVLLYQGNTLVINSLLSGNKATKDGGGIYAEDEIVEFINTTVSGNYADERGGGISLIGGTKLALKNSIIWTNASPEGNQLWLCATCEATLSYCFYGDQANDIFITAGGVLTPSNSSTNNPRFLNPYPPTSENTPNLLGNYFICGCNSPAVDAGNNAYVPAYITTDVRGFTRILDGTGDDTAIVDPGAYEFDPGGCNALAPFVGDGSSEDPYEISMLPQLYWIAVDHTRWDKHYVQVADIDACPTKGWYDGAGWLPIGNSTTPFTGTYDGQGYAINNLTINRPSTSEVGLFGRIDGASTARVVLKNIHLLAVNVEGNREVGGLVGLADQFNDIINCHVSGVVRAERNVGGLVGWGRRTDFLRCSSSVNVSMTKASPLYHGGLIGHINTASSVKESFATGTVTGRGRVGGLIGAIGWNSSVENSYARGNVESSGLSNPMIGGGVGEVWNGGMSNSYSTGFVKTNNITSSYGGFVGDKVTDSHFFDTANFWDTDTSDLSTSAMGTGESTANMKTQTTFTDAGWDFTTIWAIDAETNDGYPYLKNNPPRPTDATWDGGGDDDFTLTEENWVNDRYPAPSANSIMRFAGSIRTTPYVNHPENSSFGTILFTSTADAFTLTGNVLNIHTLIQNDATHTQTIRINLVLSGEVECNTVAGDIHISGSISGTESLTKTGNHTLLLTADDNTYSGGTTVSAGTLGGKGCSASHTIVNSGATLSPGSSIGIFSTADLTLNNGSAIEWEYQDGSGASDITASDYIAVNGTLVIDDSVTIQIIKLGDLVNAERLLFTFTDTDNPPDPDNLTFNFDEADGVTGAEAFISGTDEVHVTLVPEPGALSLLLISMLILPRIRRCRSLH